MRAPIFAFSVVLAVAGCGRMAESRLNPFNWFGGREPAAAATAPALLPDALARDGRPLVAEVASLAIDALPGGVIVRATALPPTQGWWDAALIPAGSGEAEGQPVDGVLTFFFVAAPPPAPVPARASTPRSRTLTAAAFVSNQTLEGVRRIVVRAAANEAASRR